MSGAVMRASVSPEYLRECLSYDVDTGVLIWRVRPRHHFKDQRSQSTYNARYARKPAGFLNPKDGYVQIGFACSKFVAHRIAWAIVHGEWPELEIDHVNGDRADNRLANLRQVTTRENAMNASMPVNNTSGFVGVVFQKKTGKWLARIRYEGREIYLGTFVDKAEAVMARHEAERQFGYHPNHGRASLYPKINSSFRETCHVDGTTPEATAPIAPASEMPDASTPPRGASGANSDEAITSAPMGLPLW